MIIGEPILSMGTKHWENVESCTFQVSDYQIPPRYLYGFQVVNIETMNCSALKEMIYTYICNDSRDHDIEINFNVDFEKDYLLERLFDQPREPERYVGIFDDGKVFYGHVAGTGVNIEIFEPDLMLSMDIFENEGSIILREEVMELEEEEEDDEEEDSDDE
ncbi:hypothetical protein GCK72_021748 [Caenorhabditis remanei]|uniref:Uncharacterized protein n=1 Tax=Caenorhabditis remanei TaxID=31234 RepID=A0A6A5GLM1_CAERE|nr:hypothetical protein GCK72_021748 [Caenorhabditis remanei]KAF1755179.1 hypothetical protein GCK72_021748 [Caenorhabditis remanei]